MLRREAPKLPARCACCLDASETVVWGLELCSTCHAAWWTDARFSSASIEQGAGIAPWLQGESLDRSQDTAKYTAEATRRTAAWVLERQRRAA